MWVNSLDRSGFSGSKVVLCAEAEEATVKELERRNYSVHRFSMEDKEDPWAIFRERYLHIARILKQLADKEAYRFVIAPDMKDVVFQQNPSEWLEKNIENCWLVAGSECLTHECEDWAREMMIEMFGMEIYNLVRHKLIYNAGTMAGTLDEFANFCMAVYLMLRKKSEKWNLYPDQAAVNLLIHLTAYGRIIKCATAESAWACQAGTTADPSIIQKYRQMLVEPEPCFDRFYVKTAAGVPYYLVHQYDRVPAWLEWFRELYW
jgi:hypothetical protein